MATANQKANAISRTRSAATNFLKATDDFYLAMQEFNDFNLSAELVPADFTGENTGLTAQLLSGAYDVLALLLTWLDTDDRRQDIGKIKY